jgi:quercetin dioxygenase-like cupin family protein
VDVTRGHDHYFISKKIRHTYYVLEGEGFFEINGEKIRVKNGAMISIPPKMEYAYSGKMRFLLILNPPWFKGNEIITRKNPAV